MWNSSLKEIEKLLEGLRDFGFRDFGFRQTRQKSVICLMTPLYVIILIENYISIHRKIILTCVLC